MAAAAFIDLTSAHREAIADVVRKAARTLMGADGVAFVVRDGEMCHYVEVEAISPLWKGQRFPLSACVSGWVMNHAEAVTIPDVYADPRVLHAAFAPTFVKSMAMVPVGRGRPFGAIGAYWASAHTASPGEIEMLQAIADSAALALAGDPGDSSAP